MPTVKTPKIPTVKAPKVPTVKVPTVKVPETMTPDVKPLYALAGATDMAVSFAREMADRLAKVEMPHVSLEPKTMREDVTTAAKDFRAAAEKRYEKLAERGESVVTRIRKGESTEVARKQVRAAETKVKAATTTARKHPDDARRATKAATTSVRKAAQDVAKAAVAAVEEIGATKA